MERGARPVGAARAEREAIQQPRSFGATARHSHASADKHSRGRAASKRKAAVGAYLYQWAHSRLRERMELQRVCAMV